MTNLQVNKMPAETIDKPLQVAPTEAAPLLFVPTSTDWQQVVDGTISLQELSRRQFRKFYCFCAIIHRSIPSLFGCLQVNYRSAIFGTMFDILLIN
jgi:hypothetical protein